MSKKESRKNQPKEKETTDIVKILKESIKENKELFVSLIAIIGILISVSYYVYYQGYNSYFGIDDKWNTAGDKSIYFKIVFPLCLGFLILFPNLITAFPFILKRNIRSIIWYEVLLGTVSYGLLLCGYSEISIYPSIIFIAIIITLFLLIMALGTGIKIRIASLIVGSLIILSLWGYILCNHNKLPNWERWFEVAFIWFIIFGLAYPILFCLPSKTENNENSTQDKIKSRNTSFVVTVLVSLLGFSFFEVLLFSDGQVNAKNQKSFKVILLNEDEHYRNLSMDSTNASSKVYDKKLSELPNDEDERNKAINEIESNYNKPYIKVVEEEGEDGQNAIVLRRIVNAYVVISSSGEESLVFNGYIDENNNLFYFSEEQRTINSANYITNSMTFAQVIKG